jgi:flagellar assembly protein FliH
MVLALTLEEFSQARPVPDEGGKGASSGLEVKAEGFEEGYKAGWDDATKAAEAENQRLNAELARNLQNLGFTYHEARSHMVRTVEPVLRLLVEKILPRAVTATVGERILQEIQPFIEESLDAPVEIFASPSESATVEDRVSRLATFPVVVTPETSLAEGQVHLRLGKSEKQLDGSASLARIAEAIEAILNANQPGAEHG